VKNLLLENVDPNVTDEHGRTALSHASGAGHLAIVEALLVAGAWVNPHEDYDTYETPLMTAAESGRFAIVIRLVEAGADPSLHVGWAQRTPESYARDRGYIEIANYLAGVKRP